MLLRDTFVKQLDGESPNDRNDRAIRAAAAWYTHRLQPRMRVVLLTNDADNRRKAAAEGIDARGIVVCKSTPTNLTFRAHLQRACCVCCPSRQVAFCMQDMAQHAKLAWLKLLQAEAYEWLRQNTVPTITHTLLTSWSLQQPYVHSRPDSAELVDLVAQSAAAEAEADGAAANGTSDGRPAKRQRIYADHWPLSKIEDGIKRGTLHQVGSDCRICAGATRQ